MARAKSNPADMTLAERWAFRGPERQLLLSALVAIGLGYLMLLGALPKDNIAVRAPELVPFALYMLAFAAGHAALALAGFRGDAMLLPVSALLCGLGLMAQVRMGVFDAPQRDLLDLLLIPAGVLLLLAVVLAGMRGRYRLLAAFASPRVVPWFWALVSLGLLAVLLATGQRFRGAVYGLGFLTPTELLKLTVVIYLAVFIDARMKALSRWRGLLPPLRLLWPLLAFWALLCGMLLLQRDLGMVLILNLVLLVMLGLGTRHIGWWLYGGTAAVAAGWLLLGVFSHGQRRIEAWLAPFQDPTGSGWQVLQGLSGMYSGGLWGEGFSEARPRYTPIAQSDFIYAVIAEELGFAGSALLLLLFLILIARLYTIAARARTPLGMLLATGIATVFAVQTVLNVGGVTKAIPLTGLTLPFISHGGSSLLTAFISLGLVLAVSDGEPPKSRGKGQGQRATSGSGAGAAAQRRRGGSGRARSRAAQAEVTEADSRSSSAWRRP
jgi:cell division protein FtsW (lipid II flippase)